MKLQDIIRAARKAAGMRQRDLADRLGVTHGAISQWESGITIPPIAHRIDMAEIFGLRFTDLLPELGRRGVFVDDPELVALVQALERATPEARKTAMLVAQLLLDRELLRQLPELRPPLQSARADG